MQNFTGIISQDKLPFLTGKGLLTGGAGYLGRAIIMRAQRENWPCELTVFSRDEEKQWKLPQGVQCIIGDVRDSRAVDIAMRGMDFVIHAAAMKFIPQAEYNVHEAVKTNVDGSRNVARAAVRAGVQHVIGISTDKASLPVNTYGFTKALMERMFTEANTWGPTTLSLVRYGNVVGSTGSIIPVFQRQLEERGHVCVTDPKMTRFWITADEAIDLILLAMNVGVLERGCVFVPRCGAMEIGMLAEIVAGKNQPYEIIGPRPGEKQHEDLIHYQETARSELRHDYFVVHPATQAGSFKAISYSSHSPAYWITEEQMRGMIDVAIE